MKSYDTLPQAIRERLVSVTVTEPVHGHASRSSKPAGPRMNSAVEICGDAYLNRVGGKGWRGTKGITGKP